MLMLKAVLKPPSAILMIARSVYGVLRHAFERCDSLLGLLQQGKLEYYDQFALLRLCVFFCFCCRVSSRVVLCCGGVLCAGPEKKTAQAAGWCSRSAAGGRAVSAAALRSGHSLAWTML
eukprot:scaffold18374_cov124-Isochrysis_galbana.AAC.3